MKQLLVITTLTLTLSLACAKRYEKKSDESHTKATEAVENASKTAEATAKKADKTVESTKSQTATNLQVTDATMATAVENLVPQNPGTTFSATDSPLYCFSKILGATEPTSITHRWSLNGQALANVDLPVKSASYRTFSSKVIEPTQTGSWTCEVLDNNKSVLQVVEFSVVVEKSKN